MKKLTIITILLISALAAGCQAPKKGNFIIKSGKESVQATEITINDEDNKVKYRDVNGKKGEIEGSFEIYTE